MKVKMENISCRWRVQSRHIKFNMAKWSALTVKPWCRRSSLEMFTEQNRISWFWFDVARSDLTGCCSTIRKTSTPIIVLSAKKMNLIVCNRGLEIGSRWLCDQALFKCELLARVKALLRRSELIPDSHGESSPKELFYCGICRLFQMLCGKNTKALNNSIANLNFWPFRRLIKQSWRSTCWKPFGAVRCKVDSDASRLAVRENRRYPPRRDLDSPRCRLRRHDWNAKKNSSFLTLSFFHWLLSVYHRRALLLLENRRDTQKLVQLNHQRIDCRRLSVVLDMQAVLKFTDMTTPITISLKWFAWRMKIWSKKPSVYPVSHLTWRMALANATEQIITINDMATKQLRQTWWCPNTSI